MPNLQNLLVILDGQHLTPGYLTPAGGGTALETVIALKNQFDPYTLLSNPLPNFTNRAEGVNVLLCPAWVACLAAGQNAIYLDDVSGNIDQSHGKQPAYILG